MVAEILIIILLKRSKPKARRSPNKGSSSLFLKEANNGT
jgi:hypothetical protein